MSKYLYLLVFPAILLIFSAFKEEKPVKAYNTTSHKMSVFFQADFSRTGFSDTLHVRNGQFEFLTY
jgi:hypothetical protein